jgi:hypothetical protein
MRTGVPGDTRTGPIPGSYPNFRKGIDPFFLNQPLNPNQLSPVPDFQRSSTDPGLNRFDPTGIFPSDEAKIIGSGQVPKTPGQPGYQGNPEGAKPIGPIPSERAAWKDQEDQLLTRMVQRAYREGDLGGKVDATALGLPPGGDFSDPTIEPTPIPTEEGGPLVPHEGVDVPQGAFGPTLENPNIPMEWGDLPSSPDFTPSDYFMSPPDTSDTAQVMTPGDQRPIYDPNTYTSFTDFSGGSDYKPDFPNFYTDQNPGTNVAAPPPAGETDSGQFLQNIPTNFVTENLSYSPEGPNATSPLQYDDSGQVDSSLPPPPPSVLAPEPDTGLPAAPFAQPAPPAPAGIYDLVAPDQPGFFDRVGTSIKDFFGDLNKPTDWQGTGQFFKNAGGDIVDATGKILASAKDFATKFGGSVANLAQALSGKLPSGYDTNVPGGDFWNADTGGDMGKIAAQSVTGPNIESGLERLGSNPAGRGGYFGSSSSFNPDISIQRGSFAPGQVGSSSVPAPQGGGPPSTSGPMNLGGLWGDIFAKQYLTHILKGFYTSPSGYGEFKAGAPMYNSSLSYPSYNTMHRGQVNLHDILVAHPEFYQSFMGRGPKNLNPETAKGQPTKLSRGTPPTQTV